MIIWYFTILKIICIFAMIIFFLQQQKEQHGIFASLQMHVFLAQVVHVQFGTSSSTGGIKIFTLSGSNSSSTLRYPNEVGFRVGALSSKHVIYIYVANKALRMWNLIVAVVGGSWRVSHFSSFLI